MANFYNSTFRIKSKPNSQSKWPFPDKPRLLKRSKTPLNASRTRVKSKAKKTPITKLKKQLWAITRELAFKLYGGDCYTCGARNLVGSNRHLGHFIPSSICSAEIRYSLDNLRSQCYRCNIHLSGNWIAFEEHLIKDGIDTNELKQRNRNMVGMKADSLFYINKIAEYSTLLAELNKNQ